MLKLVLSTARARWRMRPLLAVGFAILGLLPGLATPPAWAGGPLFRNRARVVPTTAQAATPSPYPMLGTFYPDPVINVRGNAPVGGGYAPLGLFGDTTMSLYGPFSPMRATAAPVLTYSRGYNGQPIVREDTAFSTPFLPALSPVIYPTQATPFYGLRTLRTSPWRPSAINWVDQN